MKNKVAKIITIMTISIIMANSIIYAVDEKDAKTNVKDKNIISQQIIDGLPTTNTNIEYEGNNITLYEYGVTWVFDASIRKETIKDNTTQEIIKNKYINFIKNDGTKEMYYAKEDGSLVDGWLYVSNGDTYFFETKTQGRPDGNKKGGWQEIGGQRYYFLNDNKVLKNSITPENFFVNSDGKNIYKEAELLSRIN